MKKLLIAFGIIAFAINLAYAGPEHKDMKAYEGSVELQKLKTLVGKWEGTGTETGEEKITVDYKLTGNGSTVVETIGAGTPMEMTSVYHDKGGKLIMTHYCALGNVPVLELETSGEDSIALTLSPKSDIDPNEAHMHALTLTMKSKDTLMHEWAYFENGEQKGITTFTLTRVK